MIPKEQILMLIFICSTLICSGQDCLDSLLGEKPYNDPNEIINGRKWISEKPYSGTPLLFPDYWPEGDILYNGSAYFSQVMNYDLSKDEMIIYRKENGTVRFVVLDNDRLKGFSCKDTVVNRIRSFIYTELPGTTGRALYENASSGGILLYIKKVKKAELGTSTGNSGQYADYYEYYLKSGGERFALITSRRQFQKLIPDREADIRDYMHKKNFRINNRHPEGIIDLIRYLGNLK